MENDFNNFLYFHTKNFEINDLQKKKLTDVIIIKVTENKKL